MLTKRNCFGGGRVGDVPLAVELIVPPQCLVHESHRLSYTPSHVGFWTIEGRRIVESGIVEARGEETRGGSWRSCVGTWEDLGLRSTRAFSCPERENVEKPWLAGLEPRQIFCRSTASTTDQNNQLHLQMCAAWYFCLYSG